MYLNFPQSKYFLAGKQNFKERQFISLVYCRVNGKMSVSDYSGNSPAGTAFY